MAAEEREESIDSAKKSIAQILAEKAELIKSTRLFKAPAQVAQIAVALKELNEKLKSSQSTLQKLVTVGDMVNKVTGGKVAQLAEDKIGKPIDKFLEKYGNKSFDILKIEDKEISIPTPIPIITIKIGFGASLNASLVSKREGAIINSDATLTGRVDLKVGIFVGFSFKLLFVKVKFGIEGGVQGSAQLTAKAGLTLEANKEELVGTLKPITADLTLEAKLYFIAPKFPLVKKALAWVSKKIKGSYVEDLTLYYPLGKIQLFTLTTPSYSLNFSVAQGKFSLKKSEGKVQFKLHPFFGKKLAAAKV